MRPRPRRDVRRPAIEACLLAVLNSETELRRDHDTIAQGTERFADELLVCEGPVHLGRVEVGDARVYRGPEMPIPSSRSSAARSRS